MRKDRILAVIMSVLMMLSILPNTVFAEEITLIQLDGKLKVCGCVAEGEELSAEFKEVKPEGITEEDVTYLWSRKTVEDEELELTGEKPELKELSKEKKYTVTAEDVGAKIVLTITGKEDRGFGGSLEVVTDTVIDAQTAAEQKLNEIQGAMDAMQEALNEDQETSGEEISSEETAADEDSIEELPVADAAAETVDQLLPEDVDTLVPEESVNETGIPEATEDGTYISKSENTEVSPQGSVIVGDGSTDAVDFGTVLSSELESVEGQYVTVANTGNTDLNFDGISPEHFAVQDITEPLKPGESVSLWVVPRAGIEEGSYEDTITYSSAEGVEVSYTAKIAVVSEEVSAAPEVMPEVTLESSPEVTPEVALESSLETTPEAMPETTPEVTPEVTPEATPEVTPETTPEAMPVPVLSDVNADTTEINFGNVVQGYTAEQAAAMAQTVTLTNSGTADAVLSAAVSDAGAVEGKYFDIVWTAQTAAVGNQTPFVIQPKAELTPETYTESFTITVEDTGKAIVITASITVESQNHSLTLSANRLDFASAKKGYSDIAAQQLMVTNTGNVTETLTMPVGTYFNITKAQESTLDLAPGTSAVFYVQPKDGLDVNTWDETVNIVSTGVSIPFSMVFQVIKGTASVTAIRQPEAISGLPNGTRKDASSLKLPSTVVIETTAGNMKASVLWDVKSCAYKQLSTEAQKFTVSGTVSLPSGVDNDNKLSLTVSVTVSVKGYTPKTALAENNVISGIDQNGVYTTQSKISFTATGAGMDNNAPRKGDTRYVPMNWNVIITNGWSGAPYTASFGLAQSGDYTLKVVFKQQQFDGNVWKDTGSTDVKQVAFSVTKAQITAPGTDLTPAANKIKAVKTGDDTTILPFVFILVIAAVVISGIIVYKKKNNKK